MFVAFPLVLLLMPLGAMWWQGREAAASLGLVLVVLHEAGSQLQLHAMMPVNSMKQLSMTCRLHGFRRSFYHNLCVSVSVRT